MPGPKIPMGPRPTITGLPVSTPDTAPAKPKTTQTQAPTLPHQSDQLVRGDSQQSSSSAGPSATPDTPVHTPPSSSTSSLSSPPPAMPSDVAQCILTSR